MGGNFGMCICNDRRWPETYRVMGLQNVEMVVLGYNTPRHHPPAPEHDALSDFHNQLSMQGGAYANATWVVGVAKAGVEEGCELIGGSCIIAPTGQIVAQALTLGDELVVARCDLDLAKSYKETTFNFAKHRQPAAIPPDRRADGRAGPDVKSPLPIFRGERAGERQHRPEQAAAPHPDPLPIRTGRGSYAAVASGFCAAGRSCRWQAAKWPVSVGRSGGSSVRQRSNT